MTEPEGSPGANPANMEAADISSLKIWNDVPDGSTLTLELVPASGSFIGQAILGIRGIPVERWADPEIHPGPKPRILASDDERYNLIVTATFGLPENAILVARITRPNGTPHETPYIHPMSGANGEVDSAAILINMA